MWLSTRFTQHVDNKSKWRYKTCGQINYLRVLRRVVAGSWSSSIKIVYLPTYPPTYHLEYRPTYLPTYLPKYILTNLLKYRPTYLPTQVHTYKPTKVQTYRISIHKRWMDAIMKPFKGKKCSPLLNESIGLSVWFGHICLRF